MIGRSATTSPKKIMLQETERDGAVPFYGRDRGSSVPISREEA
jgi:hypothetical protein